MCNPGRLMLQYTEYTSSQINLVAVASQSMVLSRFGAVDYNLFATNMSLLGKSEITVQ